MILVLKPATGVKKTKGVGEVLRVKKYGKGKVISVYKTLHLITSRPVFRSVVYYQKHGQKLIVS